MTGTADRRPGGIESAVVPELVIEGPAETAAAPGPIRTGRDPETGEHRIEIARVGRYRFVPGAAEVRAEPCAGTSPATLHAAYLATVLPLALQAAGHQLLHASAIDTPQGVIAFCGHSGTGKSTFAAALAQRGHPQWADDAVWWEIERDENGEPTGARTRRLPFQQRLRPDAASWLGQSHAGATSGSHRACDSTEPTIRPLRAVYLLSPRADDPDTAHDPPPSPPPTPLRLVHAFPALVDNAYCFEAGNRALGALADTYLALAIAVPVTGFTLPGGLGRLVAALPLLSESLGSAGEAVGIS